MNRKGILFAAAGLLIVVVGLVVVLRHRGARALAVAAERFESEIGTLDPLAHAPPGLPDEDNAAFWFQEGFAALETTGTDRAAVNDLWENDRQALGPAVEDYLRRNAVAFEHFHRAGGLRFASWGVRYESGPNPPVPDLLEQLWGKKVIATDARAALAAGNRERLLADVRALASLYRALEREPLLIFQLIATNVELSHHQLVQEILLSDLGDAELLRELAEQLDARSTGQAMQSALAVEGSWIKSTIEHGVDDGGPFWQQLWRAPASVWAPYESAAGIDLYYRLAKAAELPATRIEPFLYSAPESTPVIGIIAKMLIPNLIDGLEKRRAAIAARRLARLSIGLRLDALAHGGYPESPADFVRETADPYAEGPLHYQRLADGTVVLSFPAAEAFWQQRYTDPERNKPLFDWRLPPEIARSAPSESNASR